MKIIISIAATAELIYNGASGYRIGSGSPDPPLYFFISLCNALASSGVFTFSSFFKYSLCTSGVLSSFFTFFSYPLNCVEEGRTDLQ